MIKVTDKGVQRLILDYVWKAGMPWLILEVEDNVADQIKY